ncbi:DNA polymerase alpha accessory factor Mcl1 [Coemansia javaensis]|uniref:DNA polymerase alpha accessory factor Mcl1 n=1 Tax=Coemansia javaensis TaxID=2761396 RepID=A0A9W8LHQ5_9FUNG|nr:DNA polymerase alpha accessory factor Mcl1 [Coemansia javaensis]
MAHSITGARFAHADGYTAVAFGRSGEFICTGGSDSLVRVFQASRAERDQEAITLEQHTDNVLSLAASQSKVVSGDEEGMVYSFDVGEGAGGRLAVDAAGTVLRAALPARDISISSSERQVAIATDDDKIAVVSLLDMAPLHMLEGHRGSVNSVSYSPDSAFLASTGCNGSVRVWDMRESEPACVSVTHKMAYVCEPGRSQSQSKARWSPDGRFVAVPCGDHAVRLLERGSWTVAAELGGKHAKMITHVAWSANSKYLASVGLDCQVVVWDVAARAAILSHTSAEPLCQVDWNPQANMLAFTDCAGALYVWDDVIPIEKGHAAPHKTAKPAPHAKPRAAELASELFDDSAAVDNGGDGEGGDGMDVDGSDAGGDGDGDDDGADDLGEALDDFVVDDDDGGYAERPAAPQWIPGGGPQTRAFQPGATPWSNGRRYMAFNMVGSVALIAQDATHNSVEIEFYDKSLYRDLHFSDTFKFALAALSDAGCLFATTTKELANDQALRSGPDADEPSVVSYRSFASWAANSDWIFKLPPKEHPRCIAASSHGAAVVTSLGMLRLLTCGGVQRHIESLPNRAVTCVARADLLLLVFEALGSARSTAGARAIEYEHVLMTMDGQTRIAAGACPVSPSAELVWAGFSEEGHPATYDSKGILRVLHRYWTARDAAWVPVLDTLRLSRERNRREYFWPVALSARQFIVAGCRDKMRHPPFPRPILDELDLDIPLLATDTHVGQQEAKCLAMRLFCEQEHAEAARTGGDHAAAQARDDLEQDKLLLRLIQLACKADKMQRAVDLAHMIKLERSLDAAVKIAVHQKLTALAERIMRIRDSRSAEDDSEADAGSELESEDEAAHVVAPDAHRPRRNRNRPPTVTYGRGPGSGAADDAGEGPDAESTSPPAPGGMVATAAAAAAAASGEDRLVSRPPRPPVAPKPFNPFGVAAPSTSMEIHRSDSFFNAADQIGSESSAAASPAPAKRLSSSGDAASAPRKQPKTGPARDRAQAKMSAFVFKKPSAPPAAASGDDDAANGSVNGDGANSDDDAVGA